MSNKLLFLDMDGVIVDLPEGSSKRWGEVGYWKDLQKLPHADHFVDVCLRYYTVHILSSLGGGPSSATGKMLWLDRHYPELREGAILTKRKYLLAGPDRILVDDDPSNIFAFTHTGGEAVLFPNPVRYTEENTRSVEEVIEWLIKLS